EIVTGATESFSSPPYRCGCPTPWPFGTGGIGGCGAPWGTPGCDRPCWPATGGIGATGAPPWAPAGALACAATCGRPTVCSTLRITASALTSSASATYE